jgi:proline dehydrogenase
MNPMRGLFLAGSQSAWLRRQATRRRFVRRAVSRFMPGETLDDAIRASSGLRQSGMGVILTHLGENVTTRDEAEAVARHYGEMLDRLRGTELDAEVSVKLTQLGLDLGSEVASPHVAALAARAAEQGRRLWIDMEGSAYTDVTLEIFRQLRPRLPNLGVCLQSYLRRTAADLETLIPLGPAVRMVKGAYSEPASIAFQGKREVDENFFALSARLLGADARQAGAWLAVGTHDPRLIARVEAAAAAGGCPRDGLEFAMLYGIGLAEQERLAHAGYRVRVLISYGTYWFPWYMRRLAERPANVLFVVRNMLVARGARPPGRSGGPRPPAAPRGASGSAVSGS